MIKEQAMRNSPAYRFTTHDETDQRIERLKLQAKIENAKRRVTELSTGEGISNWRHYDGSVSRLVKRQRVVVRGRLGKHNVHAPLYRLGGSLHRRCAQTIRPEHATRFDVYIQETTRTIK
jgi:hypothetical protein